MAVRRSNISITWTANERFAMAMKLLGYSGEFIKKRTGLSIGQISYRVSKLHLQGKSADFRNGRSPLALSVLSANIRFAQPIVSQHIESNVKPKPLRRKKAA